MAATSVGSSTTDSPRLTQSPASVASSTPPSSNDDRASAGGGIWLDRCCPASSSSPQRIQPCRPSETTRCASSRRTIDVLADALDARDASARSERLRRSCAGLERAELDEIDVLHGAAGEAPVEELSQHLHFRGLGHDAHLGTDGAATHASTAACREPTQITGRDRCAAAFTDRSAHPGTPSAGSTVASVCPRVT